MQPGVTTTTRATELLSGLIATSGVSRDEHARSEYLTAQLLSLGLTPARHGNNIVVTLERGKGPVLLFNTHIDTVPPAAGYTRDPFKPSVEGGKLYGLGSNDAGGAIASMIFAALDLSQRDDWHGTLKLALSVEEEVSGPNGLEHLLKDIGMPDAAIVGEPTGLDICIAQKGLVVMDCVNTGQSCHAANAWREPHINAIHEAMRDVGRVPGIAFEARDPFLGPTTLNVTVIHGGTVHNSIPDRCEWKIDCRVNPAQTLDEVVETVKASVKATVSPRSLRLQPFRTEPDQRIVRAASAARPKSKTFGSDTMSDATFLRTVPVIKAGPGVTEMSHKPDEFLPLFWIDEGVQFYRDAALEYFRLA